MATWHIAQGENVQGPFSDEQIRSLVASGRLKEHMHLSENGGDWRLARDVPGLFTPIAPPSYEPRRTPGAAPRSGSAAQRGGRVPQRGASGRGHPRGGYSRPGVPGPVIAACLIVLIIAGLSIWAGLAVMELGAREFGLIVAIVGGLQALSAAFAWAGFNAARIAVIVLAGLGILGGLMEFRGLGSLIGLGLNVLVIALLCTSAAGHYFNPRRSAPPRRRRQREIERTFD